MRTTYARVLRCAENHMVNKVTGLFADMPIRGQDISLTCQFANCGQFVERHFTDKQDYSWTNCLKSPLYLLPHREQRLLNRSNDGTLAISDK